MLLEYLKNIQFDLVLLKLKKMHKHCHIKDTMYNIFQ